MPVIPHHLRPANKQDCYDTWKKMGRLEVPRKRGGLVEVWIVDIEDRTDHIVITGRTNNTAPLRRFIVVFGDGGWPRPALLWRGDCRYWL